MSQKKKGQGCSPAHPQATAQPQGAFSPPATEKMLSICPPTPTSSRWTAMEERLAQENRYGQISVTRAERVEGAKYEWLAEGRVPRGALCVVAGEPGTCKSLLTAEWAARASEGTQEADAALIAHGVDLPAPLMRARLDAAGANVERIALASLGWPEPGDDQSFAQLERRIAALAAAMHEGKACNLLVVDNFEAWAGGPDAAPCRARKNYFLVKLAELAMRTKTAVVVLARLNGPAGGRVAVRELAELSSIAPVVWLSANDADDPERRLLLPIKNSLGRAAPAAAFRIEEGRVVWDAEPVAAADALIAPPSARRVADQHDREGAADWLLAALSCGPVESGELFRQARSCGVSAKTLRRAGKALGLKPRKIGFEGHWEWGLEARGEIGSRNSEVGGTERGTRNSENGADNKSAGVQMAGANSDFRLPNSDLAKAPNYDGESSQRMTDHARERKPAQKPRQYLDLNPLGEVYGFSACAQSLGGAAKLAK